MRRHIINTLFGCGWLLVFVGCCIAIACVARAVALYVPGVYLVAGVSVVVFIMAGWLIGDAVRG